MRNTVLVLAVLVGVAMWFFLPIDKPQDAAYQRRTKQQLLALAHDNAATAQRLAAIQKDPDRWTDGRVGITADGYVFYYDLHESHGQDLIRDTHILYLPDEHRFCIAHDHFCCDLSKFAQAKNKDEVVRMFD